MNGKTIFPSPSADTLALPVFVTGASAGYTGVRIQRPYGYEHHQIALCTAGAGRFTCGDTQMALDAGCCFFFRKDIPHAYEPLTELWTLKWATFDGPGCPAVLDWLAYPSFGTFRTDDFEPSALFDRLVLQLERNDPFRASLVLQELLLAAMPRPERQRESERMEAVLRCIRTQYGRCLSLDELAGIHGCSTSWLCRAFRDAYGVSPMQYLNRHRISVAKSLLADTDLEIREIASRCGFSDPDYFCTAFRRQEDCPPSAFRARFRPDAVRH